VDRRFEAVVVWSANAMISAPAAQALVALCNAGVPVGWLAPDAVDALAGRLNAPAMGAAPLILADSGGTGAVVVDSTGLQAVG
jgi:hypothetical protein